MTTLLFICSGNTCRSPMAEAIARHLIDEMEGKQVKPVNVMSAGVDANEGEPINPAVNKALKPSGIQATGSSKLLTADMIARADIVFAMTNNNVTSANSLVDRDGDQTQKIVRLDENQEIDDPLGNGQSEYDKLAERLLVLIEQQLRAVCSRQ